MFVVQDRITIAAPIDRCFLLSTSIEIVQQTLGMKPVRKESRKTSGFVATGDQLLWRGWKFGLPQMHETLITGYDPPRFFQDTMGRGRFAHFQHDHRFTSIPGSTEATELSDEVRFTMPFGWPGRLVGRLIMVPHIRGLLRRRFRLLKRIAETEQWRDYLPAPEAHLTA